VSTSSAFDVITKYSANLYKLFGSVDILAYLAHLFWRRCARWRKWG
jgi:hypothetical protein